MGRLDGQQLSLRLQVRREACTLGRVLGLRATVTDLLLRPGVLRRTRPLLRGAGCVFMVHRMADPDLGVDGKPAEALDRILSLARREGFRFLSLRELFRRLVEGPPLEGELAFSMDDGTEEQLRIAGPIFAKHGCPATLFLVTDFVDGKMWLWWHRIEHAFETSPRSQVELELGGERLRYGLDDLAARRRAADQFANRLKRLPEEEKEASIQELAVALDADLPDEPPARYRPLTWDDARTWEKSGIRFAPHTRTHRILSKLDESTCRAEIEGSWRRLQEELTTPDPVFAYPNGQPADFGAREQAMLAELGFEGAFAGRVDYAEAGPVVRDRLGRFGVPRLDLPEDLARIATTLSGIRRLRERGRAVVGR